jgi:hypothetical protein
MSAEDAWQEVACECPRRIMGVLHAAGRYVHCTSARFPGKVLCFDKDSELPADWEPTEAQVRAWTQDATQPSTQARHA